MLLHVQLYFKISRSSSHHCFGCSSIGTIVIAGANNYATMGDATSPVIVCWLNYVIGMFTVINAIFNMCVVFSHPGFKSGGAMGVLKPLDADPRDSGKRF